MYGSSFINPYMYGARHFINGSNIGRIGLGKGFFSNLFKNFSLSNFLNGTSKTLNVINQAIPIYYQVKPIFSNAKTMFKVMNAVKSDSSNSIKKTNTSKNIDQVKKESPNTESPTFFI